MEVHFFDKFIMIEMKFHLFGQPLTLHVLEVIDEHI